MSGYAAEVVSFHGRNLEDPTPPIAYCLSCGHEQPLALYREGTNIGLCRDCRDLAAENRGPCSPARDCACWHRAALSTPGGSEEK